MAKRKGDPWWIKALAILVVAAFLAAIFSLVFAVRVYAPCWMFPLKEAPVRCLVVK